MNLLSEIIRRLNQRVAVANIFDKQFGLCELNANGNDKAWIHYIGDGQGEVVTNFDAKQGTIFWAKRGKVNISIIDSLKVSGCKKMYQTTFPLTAYAVVRKSHLPCDSEDAQDWIASRVFKLTSGMDFGFKASIGVMSYEVIPNGYANEIKSLTQNYEWACVSIDIDVQIVSSADDGCYDTCETGEIPLPPNYAPCTPCLTEVAVDGVTIIGNGTVSDPLVAIGGGGGTPLITKEDGTTVSANTTTLNFTGAGATATLTSPGVVEVNIPGGGGGGVGTLQQVTDLGNTTDNDIQFDAGVGVLLDNGARLREGTTDGGLGGNKGIAQRCSIDYELKWEAGRQYVMQQDGFVIREVRNTFAITPTVNDDVTDGYVVGSRWVTDSGDVYLCTDPTATAAVWEIVPNADWNATSGSQEIANKPSIPAAQVNSDWNAVSGVEEILNKPSIPAAQIQSDWTQANNAALDFIKNKPTIPAGGLPSGGTAGQILTKVDATDYNATWQENYADWTSVVKHTVKNNGLSGTITKGTAVYVTGSNGTNMLVGRASNASEATSSKTMGLMQSDITTTGGTQTGFVVTEGLLGNLNTAGTTAGDPVWLGVNGALIYGLINKPYAPAHLVFIGIVTKVSAGSGEIFVKVQNGFELKEIHDVDLITTTPVNGHVLGFDGTLWVNKTVAGWLGFTPQAALSSGVNIKTINSVSILGSGNLATPFELVVAASDESTALTTGTAKITFRMPRAVTLSSVRASLTTAQASGTIFTVDINEGGVSILSTKLTIDNTEKTSVTAVTAPVISDANLADDAEMTIDIDQIGNGSATGLKVMLIGNYA